MKHFAVVVLTATGVFAADFVTGQAARAVIGQPYFTAQTNSASAAILGGASGLAYGNGALFVADSNRLGATPENNRVVIYNSIQQQLHAPTDQIPQGARCNVCTSTANVVLGQPDFSKTDVNLTQSGLAQPTAVATDGARLVVADTNNNRILIWKTIPASNNQPADLVLGQPDFTTNTPNTGTGDARVPNAKTLRGPQGVWIQGDRLFVADVQNHRVLIWNTFPASNFKEADVVLGQPNFTTTWSDAQQSTSTDLAKPNTLLNPVAVSSDGVHLFVTDLGNNRVLIWDSIPAQNAAPADFVIGQPDLNSSIANNSFSATRDPKTGAVTARNGVLCATNGTDSNNIPTFPDRCAATLSFPRFALSDGTRLYIADGGNDRVLIFKSIPSQNGARADIVLGQVNDTALNTSDIADAPDALRRAAADAVRTPCSLAMDGTNLYVSEPFSRRVLVFSPGSSASLTPVRNSASVEVYAHATISLTGTPKEADVASVKIEGKEYKYTIKKNDTLQIVLDALTNSINAGSGDPNVIASEVPSIAQILLTARQGGLNGNNITVDTSGSTTTGGWSITSTAMRGGNEAARLAPGTLVSIFGQNLADQEQAADSSKPDLPTQLAGVEVYFDGRRAPLLYAGPNQVNAQLPYEISDGENVNAYVRTVHNDGSVTVSNAVNLPIVPANPGIFTYGGPTDPRPVVAVHYSSNATGTIDVAGSVKQGDTATVKIEDRSYTYTAKSGDQLWNVRDGLINLIRTDPKVTAFTGAQWTRIRIKARVEGTAGNGIAYTTSTSSGSLVLTKSNEKLCCANTAGAPITTSNPAIPGETIVVFATGLGAITPQEAMNGVITGKAYTGTWVNNPAEFVSSMVGGKTASVLAAALRPGTVGIYQIELELNTDLPTNPTTSVHIAQDVYISNEATFPLVKP